MPVIDTEFLFALSPHNPKHKYALNILEKYMGKLLVPDTVLFEFLIVLRSYGRSSQDIRDALKALRKIFSIYSIKEMYTINTHLLIIHIDLMEKYGLPFFDSLIAASTLIIGDEIISDDRDFDKIPDLKRIPLTP
ncbi:MAG: hypothetical protein B6U89_02965 [Desulfurococcales archaeon ex4484_58]|nr:MAG: hypothetical protein B6U89_02965 [Desulfurococcales archaeon ex4484_58]